MSRTPPPLSARATADCCLINDLALWFVCGNCSDDAKPNLAEIVQKGLGQRPINDLKFMCSACGSRMVHPRLSSVSADRCRPDD